MKSARFTRTLNPKPMSKMGVWHHQNCPKTLTTEPRILLVCPTCANDLAKIKTKGKKENIKTIVCSSNSLL